MLIAASRWFSQRPRGRAALARTGPAPNPSRLVRRRLWHRLCLSLKPGGAVPIPFSCRRYRTRHGLANRVSPRRRPTG
jgi:hypothetical protein